MLVEFDFRQDDLILSVSDDGIGLPEDYAERGHGFANMRQDTERLGGRLIVEQRGSVGGAARDLCNSVEPQFRGGIDCYQTVTV